MPILILGASRCALCDLAYEAGERPFSTWGVFLPADDPRCRYCDAAFHWDCYAD